MDALRAARRWADAWARAWRTHDVELVGSLYVDGSSFRSQPFRELDIGLVRDHLKARVRVQLELCLDRGDHVRMTVAGVQHRNAAGKVDVALCFDVPQLRVAAARDEDLVGLADAPRHGGMPTSHERGVREEGLSAHRVSFQRWRQECRH